MIIFKALKTGTITLLMKIKVLLTTICLLCFTFCKAQLSAQYYDLDFKAFNDCNWDWLNFKRNCSIGYDNASKVRSLQIAYERRAGMPTDNMEFTLNKHVILPPGNYKTLEVSLLARNTSDSALSLTIVGIDRHEKIILKKSSHLYNSSQEKDITVTCPAENLKAFNVYIRFKGNTKADQKISLKKLNVRMDGKNMQQTECKQQASLAADKIIPLESTDSINMLKSVPSLENKKIIALGECTHGSETIANARILFLKNLITSHQCKLVLLEIHFDVPMLYDLYVQGLTNDTTEAIIAEYLKIGMDVHPMMSFLKWLKKYNSATNQKVHIIGIDNSSSGNMPIPLMDYILALLGQEKGAMYLQKFYSNQIEDAAAIARKDAGIRSTLGEKNYAYFLHALGDKFSKDEKERFSERDQNMALRVAYLDSLFTSPNEKIAILAHSSHIQKIDLVDEQYQSTLGNLLAERYGARYHALNFTFGSGTFCQDSCMAAVKIIDDSLQTIPVNSFEYAALKTNYPFFYYPTRYIDSTVISAANISRVGQHKNAFKFTSLSDRFDACIYTGNSRAFTNINKDWFRFMLNFFYEKRTKYAQLINSSKSLPN